MVAVVTRSRRLRAPEGFARLDFSHPLTRSLSFAMIASLGPIDLVTGTAGTLAGAKDFALPAGRAMKFAGTDGQGAAFDLRPLSAGNLWTIMVYCDPQATGGPNVIFSQRNGVSPFEQIDLAVNSSNTLVAEAGSLALFTRTTAPVQTNGSQVLGAVTGKPAWYGVTVRADGTTGGQRYFRDGQFLGAATCNAGTVVSANESLRVGNLGEVSGTTWAGAFSIGAAFAWNSILEDEEVDEFCADPWALLWRPRRLYAGVIVAPSASTGTLGVTLGGLTLSASAVAPIAATSAIALSDATLAGGASLLALATCALTFDDAIAAATAAAPVEASGAIDLESLAAAGTVGQAATASLAADFADLTAAGTAVVPAEAQAAIALADAILAASVGNPPLSASLAQTLDAIALTATAAAPAEAAGAIGLDDADVTSAAAVAILADGLATLAGLNAAGTAALEAAGALGITLDDATIHAIAVFGAQVLAATPGYIVPSLARRFMVQSLARLFKV